MFALPKIKKNILTTTYILILDNGIIFSKNQAYLLVFYLKVCQDNFKHL